MHIIIRTPFRTGEIPFSPFRCRGSIVTHTGITILSHKREKSGVFTTFFVLPVTRRCGGETSYLGILNPVVLHSSHGIIDFHPYKDIRYRKKGVPLPPSHPCQPF